MRTYRVRYCPDPFSVDPDEGWETETVEADFYTTKDDIATFYKWNIGPISSYNGMLFVKDITDDTEKKVRISYTSSAHLLSNKDMLFSALGAQL